MRGFRIPPTYANVVATIALFVALGGTAIATHPGGQNTISTADIINGEVKPNDLAANSVGSGKIADRQVKNADLGLGASSSNTIADGGIQGIDVQNNTLTGADVDESTLDIGARAYAHVDTLTCTGTPGTCPFDESKGVSSVTRDQIGEYCVTAPGIDAHDVPAAVTVDYLATHTPEGNTSAMTVEGFACGPTGAGFLVVTHRQPTILVDSSGGSNEAVAGTAETNNDVGFTIVIP